MAKTSFFEVWPGEAFGGSGYRVLFLRSANGEFRFVEPFFASSYWGISICRVILCVKKSGGEGVGLGGGERSGGGESNPSFANLDERFRSNACALKAVGFRVLGQLQPIFSRGQGDERSRDSSMYNL